MQVFFAVQNLAQSSDSVGFDCIFQYQVLKERLGAERVQLFADLFDETLHPDVVIRPMTEFKSAFENTPDAVVIYHFSDGWVGFDEYLAECARPCIVRWHNNTAPGFYALDNIDFAAGCLRGFQTVAGLARSPHILFHVNSEFTARQLEALDGSPSRICVVYPASPLLALGELPREPRRPDDGERPVRLLFVSRVVPHKGHKHVLAVAALVQRHLGRPVEVTFVGSVEERLKRYREELGSQAEVLAVAVLFTGTVTDAALTDLYAATDVFVCLSEHEGFGMPVFEAMRSHVPVVAWACCAFRDLLAGHPLASPDYDLFRFAASVIAALDPEVWRAVEPLQQRILAGYTAAVVAGQLVQALESQPVMPPAQVTAESAPTPIKETIAGLTRELRRTLDGVVAVPTHDAPLNLMGHYDMAVFQRLLDLMRKEAAEREHALKLGLGDPRELHPHAEMVGRLMAGAPASSLPRLGDADSLLDFDDEVLVKLGYVAALGRDADLTGARHALRRLRRGWSKADFLRSLSGSEEARQKGLAIEGLPPPPSPSAPAAEHTARRWFEFARQPALPQQTTDPAMLSRVERMQDGVGRLTRYLVPVLGDLPARHPLRSIHHVDDLLALNDAAFIEAAFSLLLGRAGDEGGLLHYGEALRAGTTRRAMLAELSGSEEARAHGADIEGLDAFIAGRVEAPIERVLEQRLSKLENDLGRLVQTLVGVSGRESARLESTPTPRDTLLRLMPASLRFLSEPPQASSVVSGLPLGDQSVNRVHQIYIADVAMGEDAMPPLVRANIASIRHFHPQAAYRLWTGPELRDFIKEHFAAEVVEAYDTLAAYALKADLARYCLLYVLGGLYSDLNNRFLGPFRVVPGKQVAYFREHKPLHGAVWMVQNTIVFAQPRQPEIKLAIDLVVENVRTRDYGVSSLAPSGPVLFGRAFAAIGRSAVYQVGEAINLQVDGALNRACYVTGDGHLVAARMQGGGGKPTDIGLSGTNSYGQLWEARRIYGEWQQVFAHDNPAIRTIADRGAGGIRILRGAQGCQIFGPYEVVGRGRYRVTAVFAKAEGPLKMDVCGASGTVVFATTDEVAPDAAGRVSLSFAIEEVCEDLEVRLHTAGIFAGIFLELTIALEGRLRDEVRGPAQPLASLADDPAQPQPGDAVRFIHQIVELRPGQAAGALLTPEQSDNADLLKSLHRRADYHLWTDASLRDFIASSMTPEVLQAYDRLQHFANRAELGRYCLLLVTGGLVIDPDIRLVNPMVLLPGRELACFRDARPDHDASWCVSTDLLHAIPDQAELREVIEAVLVHARAGYHGTHPSSPTGGEVLGRVLATAYRPQCYQAGEIVPLTDGYAIRNECFLGIDGCLQAVRLARAQPGRVAARSAWEEGTVYARGGTAMPDRRA